MNKNPFLKRLIKDKKKDIIHSSAYAKAQNTGIGSSSVESFQKRREIDRHRTIVRRYNESKIVTDANANKPKPRIYKPDNEKPDTSSKKPTASSRKMITLSTRHNNPPIRRNPGISR